MQTVEAIKTARTLKSQFPKTRYQGSKRKVLPWIYNSLREIQFESVLDAMGGSGMVSYLFKKMGKTVTYNDKLKFNYIIGKALIENSETTVNEETISWLLGQHNYVNYSDVIQRHFEDLYYLSDENGWLDRIIGNIQHLEKLTGYNEYIQAISYYALFQACLIKRPFNLFHRRNLNVRTADVKRSFGNAKTWERPFDLYFSEFIREMNHFIIRTERNCKATNRSVFDIDDHYDLVYFDPPYFRKDSTNETSNYLNNYHFLEGIANYSKWDSLIDFGSRNHRFIGNNSENDFRRSNVKEKFVELLAKFSDSILVVSYKKGGIPTIEFICEVMNGLGKDVTIEERKYSYALNSQNGDARFNREVLIIGI